MDALTDDIFKHILPFVGNAVDFLALEKTCKSFRRVLQEDSTWKMSHEYQRWRYGESWPPLARDKAFFSKVRRKIGHWQKSTHSIILRTLTTRAWKRLLEQLLLLNPRGEYFPDFSEHSFEIRGDTSAVIMEVVEQAIVDMLQRCALLNAAHRHNKHEYPSISVSDLRLQDVIRKPHFDGAPSVIFPCLLIQAQANAASARGVVFLGVDIKERSTLVRRFAYRAGVFKLDDDAYAFVWASVLQIAFQLLRPACIFLAHCEAPEENVKQVIDTGGVGLARQSMWNIPPFPQQSDSNGGSLVHIVVPQQIENTAEELGLKYKVYCNEELWHIDTDENVQEMDGDRCEEIREREIAEAKSLYCFEDSHESDQAMQEAAITNPFAASRAQDEESSVGGSSSDESSLIDLASPDHELV